MPASPIGTLTRKIQCQLKKVVMKPPIGGPTSGPMRPGMVSHAMAEMRSRLAVERTSTSRATGVIIAPPMPWRNLAATNSASEPENAQAIEPMTKTAMATRKTRLAPKRSAIQALTGMKIASETR